MTTNEHWMALPEYLRDKASVPPEFSVAAPPRIQEEE